MSDVLYPYSLVDVSDLKDNFGITTESTWDNMLVRIANGVTDQIETLCKRDFVARTVTESLDGSGNRDMFVRAPIIDVVSITNDGTALTEDTHFVVYKKTGKLRMIGVAGSSLLKSGGVWSTEPQAVVIEYRHGYDEQDMPPAISLAAQLWAVDLFQKLRDDRMGVASRSEGNFSITFRSEDVPPSVLQMIQPQMRMGRTR